jgi:2-polyprenyl-6-methoxyphenol hydroxylase-like FAD-dependent oxidoreductase
MAGMLAARVLSSYFERVVIVERDEYLQAVEARPGVPQGRHLHALLTRGHRIVETMFPGIIEDCRAAGAEVLDIGRDFAWRTPAGWGIRFESGLESLAASRPLMDYVLQRHIARMPNVELRTGLVVVGLVPGDRGQRVGGVRVRTRDGVSEIISAAIVVDASGRMSNAPAWLRALGYEQPAESVVDARLGYASRIYQRRPEHERAWRAVFIQAAPPEQPRAGIAFPIEGSRWIVTQAGGGGDFAPSDEQQYLDFARSLPSGEIYNLIRRAEPSGPITRYRRTENRWRHYERLRRLPEGFVVLGDATCAFNPVYGQGMTTAALHAMALDAWVRDGARSPAVFQKALANIIATPWALATGEDKRYRGSSAEPKWHERLLQAYVHQVMGASAHDRKARLALLEVFTMVAEPTRLFRPGALARVLWSAIKDGLNAPLEPAALPERAAASPSQ